MLGSNDTLSTVRAISASQPRTVTPSKIVVRHSTPQRAVSNPRSGSASKMKPVMPPMIPMENTRAPSRSMSRRKQRRWENQNVFNPGVNEVLVQALLDEDDEDLRRKVRRMPFKIEWRSAFKELFEAKNADALESFRMCAEKVDTYSSNRRRYCSPAELSWINVEKKLRQIVVKAIIKNPEIMSFINDLERLLVGFFIEGSEFDVRSTVGDALQGALHCLPHIDDHGKLSIQFTESAFNRLLLHAICQFYGFKSNSYLVGNTQLKATYVIIPNRPTAALEENVSFTQFLLDNALSGLQTKPAFDSEALRVESVRIQLQDLNTNGNIEGLVM